MLNASCRASSRSCAPLSPTPPVPPLQNNATSPLFSSPPPVPGIPVMARHWLYTLCSATFLNAVFDVLAAAVHGSLGISSAPSFDRPWLVRIRVCVTERKENITRRTVYAMQSYGRGLPRVCECLCVGVRACGCLVAPARVRG